MRKIEKIAQDNGLSYKESLLFFDFARAFVNELDKNPLDPYFTPEIIVPMLLWLVQHCEFVAAIDEIAVEFNFLVGVNSPAENDRRKDNMGVASQIVMEFPKRFPHLVRRRC